MTELTESEMRSLRLFADGDAGWGDENVDRLLELGLIDTEEDWDGYQMWVTSEGNAILDAAPPQ